MQNNRRRHAFLSVTLLVFMYGTSKAQPTNQPSLDPPGKWMIVPMPSGIKVPPAPNAEPGVWRLNTQTGALQFCYYNLGGIRCSVWDKPSAAPLFQNSN